MALPHSAIHFRRPHSLSVPAHRGRRSPVIPCPTPSSGTILLIAALTIICGANKFLHWVLDTAFREDAIRFCICHAVRYLSILRCLALSLPCWAITAKRGTGLLE